MAVTATKLALAVLATCVAPAVLLLAVVWALLGLLFTMRAQSVAAGASVLLWSCWLIDLREAQELPVQVPLAASALLGLCLCIPKSAMLHCSLWVVLAQYIAYCAQRGSRVSLWFAVLACLLPAWSSICSLRLWLPANGKALHAVETKIYARFLDAGFTLSTVAGLGTVHVPYSGEEATKLHSETQPKTLVLIHGYGAGNAFWAANLKGLAKSFDVYIVEWKGIGRSLRPRFQPKNAVEADAFFVEALEEWRNELEIERFILCGHSMGAMFATYYSAKYSDHIEHLILASPAGVNASPFGQHELPLARRIAFWLNLTPMSAARAMGPLGPRLVHWMVKKRTSWTPPSNAIRAGELDLQGFAEYCYHNWALKASGDIAVHTHLHPGAAARETPLCDIIVPQSWTLPVTFLYGGGPDWMPKQHGIAVVERLQATERHYATVRTVPLSGHQIFLDNPSGFNQAVIQAVRDWELREGTRG